MTCPMQAATLGVGPPQVIPLKELSRTNLQSQIMSVSDEGAPKPCMRVACVSRVCRGLTVEVGAVVLKRARELADTLREEVDGVANAVAWLERYVDSAIHPHNYAARKPWGQEGRFVWLSDDLVSASQHHLKHDTTRNTTIKFDGWPRHAHLLTCRESMQGHGLRCV